MVRTICWFWNMLAKREREDKECMYMEDEIKRTYGILGCIRIADDNIAELKQLTDMLEAIDPTEHGTTLEVQNNLSGSLQYSRDKEEYKYNLMTDGYLLPEIIVTPTY